MLIDSDERVRETMRAKLETGDIEVIAERAHGIAAQQAIQDFRPARLHEPPDECREW